MDETQQKIIDNFKRDPLGEGRNYGMGYSILKKVDNNYETLMPFTACKDYLNDFIYVEGSGKSLSKVYGFEHIYTGILKDVNHFYTGLTALNYKYGDKKYEKLDLLNTTIKDNSKNIIKAINKLEEFFNIKTKTEFEAQIGDILILKTPKYWSKFSFLFSMYGLFIRCFVDITEEESNLSIFDIVKNKEITLIDVDRVMLEPMKKFFTKPDISKLLDYKYPDNAQGYSIHNYGVNSRLIQING